MVTKSQNPSHKEDLVIFFSGTATQSYIKNRSWTHKEPTIALQRIPPQHQCSTTTSLKAPKSSSGSNTSSRLMKITYRLRHRQGVRSRRRARSPCKPPPSRWARWSVLWSPISSNILNPTLLLRFKLCQRTKWPHMGSRSRTTSGRCVAPSWTSPLTKDQTAPSTLSPRQATRWCCYISASCKWRTCCSTREMVLSLPWYTTLQAQIIGLILI